MSYTGTQRSALTQFIQFTQATERTAAKILKANSWNLELAIDSYYQNPSNTTTSSGAVNVASINSVFDSFRQTYDSPDTLQIAETMSYFEALGLSLEDPTVLALSEALDSPTMGEFTRSGFVDGWGSGKLGADSIERMREKVNELRNSMAVDEALFKRVYLWTFGWARSAGQKSLPLEVATEWWKIIFQNRFGGHLEQWITFLETEWKRSVPKDTWNMLYDFVGFVEKDPTLKEYDELASWPSVIDAYVEYYRKTNDMVT